MLRPVQSKILPRQGTLAFDRPVKGSCVQKLIWKVSRAERCQAVSTEHTTWSTFCEKVSGEWEGSAATFDADGQPQELPDRLVPSAYRDWGQKLHDWQTQCSSLAEGRTLLRKLKRLMPTVGCEADAIAYNEEQQTTEFDPDSKAPGPTFLSNGSYSLPASLDENSTEARAEHCFQIGDEERVRIVQLLNRADSEQPWRLTAIELHREIRECNFNGGKELAGCGGGMPGFATRERLAESTLDARWVPADGQFSTRGEAGASGSDSDEEAAVLLPLKSWSTFHSSDSSVRLRAGCFVNDDERMSASHNYTKGALRSISLGRETCQVC